MSNLEVLNMLNKENRKLIDDYLSFYTHLMNKVELENNQSMFYDSELNTGLIASISFMLSDLKNDNITSTFFNRYGINYDSLISYLDKYDLKNTNFIKAEESKYFLNFDLDAHFKIISILLGITLFVDHENIKYDVLPNYHLFYSEKDNIKESLSNLLKLYYPNINIDDMFEKYEAYIYDFFVDFAKENYGVDIKEEAEKELKRLNTFDFDEVRIDLNNEDAFITFKENANLEKIIFHVNKKAKKYEQIDSSASDRKRDFISSIKLPETFLIERIDTKEKITKKVIDSLLLSNRKIKGNIPISIKNISTDETNVIWLNKTYAFDLKNEDLGDVRITNDELPDDLIDPDDEVKTYTPYLDKYGSDLTKVEYYKDPSIGREKEIKRIEQILCYPERDKSIIITGVSGSGKTALVKGLAYRIQKGLVPNALKDLRIISIDSASLVAGCSYVGMLEEKMKNILQDASSSKNIIIFIDEIHQALGAGKAENDPTSVAEILKPYLDYGRVRIIGATTTNEYNEFVTRDEAFKTRFKKVNIDEPDDYIVYLVLEDLINSYNKLSETNKISCPKFNLNDEEKDAVIKWLIDSTKPNYRTYNDRTNNPRLVLEIIKEAYAIASLNDKEEVTIEDLKEALLNEERLYPSSKERQIQKLDNLNITSIKNNKIDFKMIKKK